MVNCIGKVLSNYRTTKQTVKPTKLNHEEWVFNQWHNAYNFIIYIVRITMYKTGIIFLK